MNPLTDNDDYYLSLYEVCELLGKSTRTITRYIRRHILHPRGVKSKQGTLEYRFSKSEIEEFKRRIEELQPAYMNQDTVFKRVPVASFASVNYCPPAAPAREQVPFIIPGVSYPPSTKGPDYRQYAPSDLPAYDQSHPADDVRRRKANLNKEVGFSKTSDRPPVDEPKKNEPSRAGDEEIIVLLRETTGMLRDQLKVKDDQIKNLDDKIGQLIERNRETNILLKGLQDKIVMLEKPKSERRDPNRTEQPQSPKAAGQSIPVPGPRVVEAPISVSASPIKIKVVNDDAMNYSDKRGSLVSESSPVETSTDLTKKETPSDSGGGIPKPASGKKSFFGKMFG